MAEIDTASMVQVSREAQQDDRLAESVFRLLTRANERLGFTYFTYLAARIPGQQRASSTPFFLSNYPAEWIARYQELNYLRVDPVYLRGMTGLEPLVWGEGSSAAGMSRKQRQFMHEASDFRISCGVTVPVHGPGAELGLFTVAQDHPDPALRHTLAGLDQQLLHIARHVHALVAQKLLVRESPIRQALTEQERLCLEWTARGKTSWEIAIILERSEATVNFHLKNAITKLNASNKCHAASKAIAHGLIDP